VPAALWRRGLRPGALYRLGRVLHHAAKQKSRPGPKGVLAQENIGFGLTILTPNAFKKPGNPSGLPGFFHATIHPKLPGRPLAAKSTAAIRLRRGRKRFMGAACGRPLFVF